LQAQAEREIAVNRIATAIRNSLKLESILQTAANEVGRALGVTSCGLRVAGDSLERQSTKCYFDAELERPDDEEIALLDDLDTISMRMAESPGTIVADGNSDQDPVVFPRAAVPLNHLDRLIGVLLVRSNDPARSWAENEVLLLHTVADQVTVAINQAHLFAQLKQQALTDGLTGCHNRRAFEIQLGRDLHFATRSRQQVSLIMMDLDNLKQINDHAGHEAGDLALQMLAETLRAELRAIDTSARFGGDEFAIILPQASSEGALAVAERLRARIAGVDIAGVNALSASFGVATFPLHASSRDSLVAVADQALYKAKHSGRNRVCLPGPAVTPANQDEAKTLMLG